MRTLLVCAMAAAFVLPGVSFAAPVFPLASGVGLEPPADMTPSHAFLGFQKGPASILVIEMPPEAFAKVNGERTVMAKQVDDARTEDFALGQTPAFIVRGTQTRGGATYRKWIVVVGDKRETAVVTAQVPVKDAGVSDEAIEKALHTIVLRDRPGLPEQVADLPFTVGDMAGFRPAATAMGVVLVLTEGPKDVDPEITQPHVIVSTSVGAKALDGSPRLDLARTVLSQSKAVKDARITSEKTYNADGAQWAEIQATATEGKVDKPVDVSLFVRSDAAGFIAVMGAAPQGATKPYADRFKQIALSIKPKG